MGTRWHCDTLHRLEQFDLIAGSDPSPERRAIWADAFGLTGCERFAEMLALDDLDLVVVATPSAMHRDHVIQAAAPLSQTGQMIAIIDAALRSAQGGQVVAL